MARKKKTQTPEELGTTIKIVEGNRKHISDYILSVELMIKKIDNGDFNLDVSFQRQIDQWDNERKSLMIHSALTDYPATSIWITATPTESLDENSVIDGIQRMSTMRQYVKDGFKLHKSIDPIKVVITDKDGNQRKEDYEIAGKKFSQLPKIFQDKILNYCFTVWQMYDYTDDEIEEQFYRVNNGVAMTPSQKIKAILGTDICDKFKPLTELGFWQRTGLKKTQLKRDDIYVIILQCILFVQIGQEYKYSSFSSKEMIKFAECYRNQYFNEKQLEYIKELIELVDRCILDDDDNNKFLTKTNIPVIINNAEKFLGMEGDEFTEKDYEKFLANWIETYVDCSGYFIQSKDNTTNGSKVENRKKIMDEWLDTYARYKKEGRLSELSNIHTGTKDADDIIALDDDTDNSVDNSNTSQDNIDVIKDVSKETNSENINDTIVEDDEEEMELSLFDNNFSEGGVTIFGQNLTKASLATNIGT